MVRRHVAGSRQTDAAQSRGERRLIRALGCWVTPPPSQSLRCTIHTIVGALLVSAPTALSLSLATHSFDPGWSFPLDCLGPVCVACMHIGLLSRAGPGSRTVLDFSVRFLGTWKHKLSTFHSLLLVLLYMYNILVLMLRTRINTW